MLKFVLAALLMVNVVRVNAVEYSDTVPTTNDNNYFKVELRSIQVCGEKLVSALMLLCGDKGYNQPSIKRDFTYKFGKNDKGALRKWYQNLENEYLIRMLEKKLNLNSELNQETYSSDSTNGEFFSRNTRGIVDECCHKPCTSRTLKLYCKE